MPEIKKFRLGGAGGYSIVAYGSKLVNQLDALVERTITETTERCEGVYLTVSVRPPRQDKRMIVLDTTEAAPHAALWLSHAEARQLARMLCAAADLAEKEAK